MLEMQVLIKQLVVSVPKELIGITPQMPLEDDIYEEDD